MGYILMQPRDSSGSSAAAYLTLTGEYLFDLFLDGPKLRHVLFRSRSNMIYERGYHYFVGEVVFRRWAIAVC